jgi:CheY-like chemotaxis protein
MQREVRDRPVVLVVEDDVLVRFTVVSSIEEAGFGVLEANGAREAVAILEMRSDIWTVVTDVQMPGSIDGLQLAHLISVRWPPIRIIAASGRLRLREDDLPPGGRYLNKPYSVSELIGILDEWAVQ